MIMMEACKSKKSVNFQWMSKSLYWVNLYSIYWNLIVETYGFITFVMHYEGANTTYTNSAYSMMAFWEAHMTPKKKDFSSLEALLSSKYLFS